MKSYKNILQQMTGKIVLLLFLLVLHSQVFANEKLEVDFVASVAALTADSFTEKKAAVDNLAKIGDERVLAIFEVMLAGKLYYIAESKKVVSLQDAADGYTATNLVSNKIEGTYSDADLTKVGINNSLRRKLRGYIAEIKIRSPKSEVRLAAVEQLIKSVDEDTANLFKKIQATETNKSIRERIEVGIALWDVNSEDKTVKLKSIAILANSLLPEAKAKLQTLFDASEDRDVKTAANKALKNIEEKANFYAVLENIVFGLSLGSVLLLIAIGLSITFGVMGVINMAHGELMMLGAYTTYVVQQMLPDYITASIFISIPVAFCVSAIAGILIERFVIRYLYGRPLETLLATFGISLILQQLVRSIFGPTNQAVETPAFMSGSFEINSLFAITYNRLYIFIFALIVFAILLMILKKTRLGLEVRAVSQNRAMAKAMGVRTEWVDAMTFGLGSGIAGVAGVALSQLTNVGPNLGQGYIIDSFMVVVFGGVGNLWGTLVGGLTLGVLNKFMEPWTGAVLAKIFVLIFIILFIQKRPRGLFPQKGRAAEN